jgi:hypothetical protein
MILKLFIVKIFMLYAIDFTAPPSCKEIEAEVQLVDTSRGLANGEIRVRMMSEGKFKLHLIGATSKNNRLNENGMEIQGLAQGDYHLVVTQEESGVNDYCPRLFKLTVK